MGKRVFSFFVGRYRWFGTTGEEDVQTSFLICIFLNLFNIYCFDSSGPKNTKKHNIHVFVHFI